LSDNNTTYHTLQDYLESRFDNVDVVTDTMLKQAKQEWRAIYLSRYYKQYRERYIQVSFRILKKQYQEYEREAKKQNIITTTYIKRLVLNKQNNDQSVTLTALRIILLQIIDSLEESLHEETTVDTQYLLSLIEKCHTLLNDR